MITRELAVALRDRGLVWHPAEGDRFQLDLPDDVELEAEAEVFTVSEMTIEARQTPSGTDLAFNGTTDWALDAVTLADAVWLPRCARIRASRPLRGLRASPPGADLPLAVRVAP